MKNAATDLLRRVDTIFTEIAIVEKYGPNVTVEPNAFVSADMQYRTSAWGDCVLISYSAYRNLANSIRETTEGTLP